MNFIPNKEQADGIEKALKWYKTLPKPVFEISGGAGTGKTTLVKHIIQKLKLTNMEVLFVAYVGKATLELTRKGNTAKTIHSTIYELVHKPKVDDNGEVLIVNGRPSYSIRFVKRKSLEPHIKLIVVDEGAMVPKDIAMDLISYGVPIIVLGDRQQLPPVFGESHFLEEPDVLLTEPMRFALDSPIIYLANQVLNNKLIQKGKYTDKCYVIDKSMITDSMYLDADVVICGKNKTRQDLNRHIRRDILKIRSEDPVLNDRVICRKNNWMVSPIQGNIYLTNGLVGNITRIDKESYDGESIIIDFLPEFLEDECFYDLKIDYKALRDWEDGYKFSGLDKFEYGYAITCHLSQGSEYNSVLIYNERMGDYEYYKSWLYTAITRSKGGLILAL